MLDVADVVVQFGERTVLDRVSLHVDDGEVVALLGPSGAGKSTLLRVIAGLLRPDTGTVTLDGVDITDLPAHARNIGMMFQDEQLFPHLDVAANVAFGPRMHRWPASMVTARVDELLAIVGLTGFATRRIERLSGGEKKRVALARSLAPRPAVLLLDEPLTGLDRELHDRLIAELADVLRATATTAVVVTHDRDEVAALASRVMEWNELQPAPRPVTESPVAPEIS
ncbi:MAG: ABC transporter ATP-binding protein [Ilumatobacteraceae bacterium]